MYSSLSFFALLLLACLVNSQNNGLKDYWLQVSHQAPTVLSNVTFQINGQTPPSFENIAYGSGSQWINASSVVSHSAEEVNITVRTIDGLLLTSQKVTLKQKFFSFFLITEKDGTDIDTFSESWDFQTPSNTSWFLMINLSPSETGKVTFRVNEDALKDTVSHQESSDWYAAVAGLYEFVVTNSDDEIVGISIFNLRPGVIHTIILNGIWNTSINQLFILENWQSEFEYSQLRSVQSIPGANATVWINEKEYWKSLSYKSITKYESVPEQKNLEIYVSLSGEMPNFPTLTIDTLSYASYSLLISQDLSHGISLQASIIEDQSSLPIYTVSSERVVYLSPSDGDSMVFFNDDFVGKVSYGEATNYSQSEDLPLNLTITNQDFRFEDEIDSVSLGSVYSIFVMGNFGSEENEMEALVSPDVLWEKIEKVDDDQSDDDDDDGDDDDDDGGLSGGEVAGVVIGVLLGVMVICGILYMGRRRSHYESIPGR